MTTETAELIEVRNMSDRGHTYEDRSVTPFAHYEWAADETRSVPEYVAEIVTAGHPGKLRVAGADVPAHRMLFVQAPVHRHHYRKSGKCSCGETKQRGRGRPRKE